MLKNKLHSLLLWIISTILLVTLTSCNQHPSPSDVALSYYELLIKQNSSQMEALGMSKETADSITANIKENLTTQITQNLSSEAIPNLPEDQLLQLQTAYFKALSKLSATATHTKGNKMCEVTLSTPCIDFTQLNEKATNLALNEVNISEYNDKDLYLSHLTTAYIKYLTEAYENAAPEEISNTATFTFTKQNGIWLPKDYDSFATELCSLISTSIE